MHELLLHASVPAGRHAQVLSILAGIAAMQPQPFHEKHMIYKPTRPVTRVVKPVGGSQTLQLSIPTQAAQGDLFYLHLVEDLVTEGMREGGDRDDEEGKTDGDVVMGEAVDGVNEGEEVSGVPEPSTPPPSNHQSTKPPSPPNSSSSSSSKYTLQYRDIPDPGHLRPCTTRQIFDVPITRGDAAAFMSAMEYTHTSTHTLRGHRLTHASTSILLFQTLRSLSLSDPSSSLPSSSSSSSSSLPPNTQPQPQPQQQPLDPTNQHILQLSLRVATDRNTTKPELLARGVKELMALKETLRGVVELEAVERGVLDTRVK
ncbi:MAG: hypothetical protein Q9184_007321 [Pyrenodesmia sp. 2 TL-2023]